MSEELFSEVSSKDILSFEFGTNKYQDQLNASILKTGQFCAVTVTLRNLSPTLKFFLKKRKNSHKLILNLCQIF